MRKFWRAASGRGVVLPGLLGCRRGAVAIAFALALVPLIIAAGVGIDLWRAFAAKARFQAALDAAALAVSSTNPAQFTFAQLQQRAQTFFTGNFPPGVVGTAGPVTLSFAGPKNNIIVTSAFAAVPTTFMRIVGVDQLTVSASSQVTLVSPNIDFYMLLDSSPSMLIGATSADITALINNTQYECDTYSTNGNSDCGCGFACHESNPSGDTCDLATAQAGKCGSLGPVCPTTYDPNTRTYTVTDTMNGGCNPHIDPNTGQVNQDNYAMAKGLNPPVTLRFDNLRTATTSLMSTAQTTEASNAAVYRVAIYTFDAAVNTIQTLTADLDAAQSAAATILPLEVYTNGCLTSSDCNSDTDTNYDNAMNTINGIMPDPGSGMNSSGDTPQEVLYWVTDGQEDEDVSSLGACPQPMTMANSTYDCDGSRQESVMDPGWCTTIKNRGIRIAVLYLVYDPIPDNAWYAAHASAYNDQIAPTLQNCATPGLFFQVQTGDDVTAAMVTLFQKAINAAYLSH
jgi:Flp pilus assembly protein TadG